MNRALSPHDEPPRPLPTLVCVAVWLWLCGCGCVAVLTLGSGVCNVHRYTTPRQLFLDAHNCIASECGGVAIQGILNLVDNRSTQRGTAWSGGAHGDPHSTPTRTHPTPPGFSAEDGGFVCVPGFHKVFADWVVATQLGAGGGFGVEFGGGASFGRGGQRGNPLMVAGRGRRKVHRSSIFSFGETGLEPVLAPYAQRISCRAGSMIYFDARLPHGSRPNHSSSIRAAQFITYARMAVPWVVAVAGCGYGCVLVWLVAMWQWLAVWLCASVCVSVCLWLCGCCSALLTPPVRRACMPPTTGTRPKSTWRQNDGAPVLHWCGDTSNARPRASLQQCGGTSSVAAGVRATATTRHAWSGARTHTLARAAAPRARLPRSPTTRPSDRARHWGKPVAPTTTAVRRQLLMQAASAGGWGRAIMTALQPTATAAEAAAAVVPGVVAATVAAVVVVVVVVVMAAVVPVSKGVVVAKAATTAPQ